MYLSKYIEPRRFWGYGGFECCEVVLLQTVRTIFKVEWAELTQANLLVYQMK